MNEAPSLRVDDLCCPGVYVFYIEHTREVYVGETNLLIRRTLQDHLNALLTGIHINAGLQSMFDKHRADLCIALFPMRNTSKDTLLDAESKKSLEYKDAGWTVHNRHHPSKYHKDISQSPVSRYSPPEKPLYFCEFCRSEFAKPLSAPNIVIERLRAQKDTHMSYREIAKRYDATAGMVWRMINEGYEPMTLEIRQKFGYGYLCPSCGHEFDEE